MNGPSIARLPHERLHLQDGPIDLVIEAFGEREEVEAAYRQAWERFQDILQTLVDELAMLRAPVGPAYPLVRGPVAKRMVAAVWQHRDVFITPMAAVAGAVAEEILEALLAGRRLRKAYVNDGGDIALCLGAGESFRAGVVDDGAFHFCVSMYFNFCPAVFLITKREAYIFESSREAVSARDM